MQTWDYIALSPAGKRVSGSITALSARQAREQLQDRFSALIEIRPAIERKKVALPRFFPSFQTTKSRHIMQGMRSLGTLLDSGIPLEEALRISAGLFPKSGLRQDFLTARKRVSEGAVLSTALRGASGFSNLHFSLMAAGESAGELPKTLLRLARDLEAQEKIKRRVSGASIYPLILTLVAIAVMVTLLTVVVPKVVEQFDNFDQTLPPLTRGTIALSDFLAKWGLALLAALAAGIALFRWRLKTPSFRLKFDRLKLRVPVLGRLIREINAARFSRNLSGLLGSGSPGLDALATAKFTLTNTEMSAEVEDVVRKVRNGTPLRNSFRKLSTFPDLFLQMLGAGEQSGRLTDMLDRAADYLESEVDGRLTVLLNLLEPVIIIILAVFVLLIIAAIFLPILQLNSMAVT